MPDFMRVDDDGVRIRVFVTLSTGHVAECKPVAMQLASIGSSIADPPKPAPPQYEMVGAGGAKEKRDHDAESAEDPKTDPKEKAAWAKYVGRLEKWQEKVDANKEKRDTMEARFISLRAVSIVDALEPEEIKEWAQTQEMLFGIVPDTGNGLPEEVNLFLLWMIQEVFGTEDDGKRVMLGIMRASGLEGEAIDQAVDMFWPPVGDTGKAGTDDTRDPSASEEEEQAQE